MFPFQITMLLIAEYLDSRKKMTCDPSRESILQAFRALDWPTGPISPDDNFIIQEEDLTMGIGCFLDVPAFDLIQEKSTLRFIKRSMHFFKFGLN